MDSLSITKQKLLLANLFYTARTIATLLELTYLFCCFAVKLGIGGFSMGAAIALYSATCRILGQYGNGNPYSVNLSAIVGLSGWLPCSRFDVYIIKAYKHEALAQKNV